MNEEEETAPGRGRGHVVAREAEGHLREVVGAEREKLCVLANIASQQAGAWDLHHGADTEWHPLSAVFLEDRLSRLPDDLSLMPQLRRRSDKRHHDVRHRLDASGLDVQRRLEDGPGLHHGDLGVLDAQTAATQPQHGVHLRERKDLGQHRLRGHVQLLRHARDYLGHISLGQELVERGIKKADGDGEAVHGSEDALEVNALEGEQLRQRLLAPREVVGHDHLPHRTDALFSREEHVLGAHQPDALRAVAPRRRH
eukprot:2156303-Rhodomonas_salina.2